MSIEKQITELTDELADLKEVDVIDFIESIKSSIISSYLQKLIE